MGETAGEAALLVLWDVDGTLIENGGVSKEAYAKGFQLITGRDLEHPVVTDGQTDPAIMRSLLERHGIDPEPLLHRIPEVMPGALESLVPRLRERGRALPGAREAIAALAGVDGIIQSVLTGNIAPNAFTKVAAFGLHVGLDFEVGGYGSDHEVRAELVHAARRKAKAKYGSDFTPSSTVLIGDTPRDAEAGQVGGAYVIGVATGKFTEQQLLDAGVSAVLPDLTDTSRLVEAVRTAGRHGAL